MYHYFTDLDFRQYGSRLGESIELNHKVPQTNQLSLGVLDINVAFDLPVTIFLDTWEERGTVQEKFPGC